LGSVYFSSIFNKSLLALISHRYSAGAQA